LNLKYEKYLKAYLKIPEAKFMACNNFSGMCQKTQ